VDQATETAFSNRQEIQVTQLQLDSANKGISIARAGYIPNLAATAAYEKFGEHPDVDFHDSWALGLGATWNIFSGGYTTFDVSRATADRNRVNFMLQAQKNQVALEVKNIYLSVEEARARIAVAEQSIAQAQENLRIQKDRYNLQVSTSTDVLDAESLFAQAQMNYITARSDYAKFMAALRSAMGTL
jgi:outer membrane protein TolC